MPAINCGGVVRDSMFVEKTSSGVKLLRPAFLLGVLALFLFGGVVRAQTIKDMPPPPDMRLKPKPTPPPKPPSEEVLDVVKVTSNLVMVPVSVTNNAGQAVQGLQVADFRLLEEGKEQQIAEIGDPEQVPLDIAVLFDISSSVSQKGFFAFQQNAAATFLREVMKPVDKAAIFTIADRPVMVQSLASAQDAAAKMVSIQAATSSVPTAFYDTVSAAASYLTANSPSRHRRVIVVISDGDDNFSETIKASSIAEARANLNGQQTPASALVSLLEKHRRAVAEVQQNVLKADAAFYSVNPGGPSVRLNQISLRAQNSMETIADASGGTAFLPDSDKDLEQVFRIVAAELRGQYLLQYYANSEVPANTFRRIQVSTPAHQEYRIRARQGFYPKKAQ
ncbi:MAG TPA: VWA domain-containing protein [Pyrinomonadaceae bacterium]|nr:VWA domain-containing protein [Pyrinomonadaceae bacterium]